MRIVSFAWTAQALLDDLKTITRRNWKDCRLVPGELVQAWDKLPHRGGKQIALIQIVSVRREQLKEITEEEVIKEGGLWENREAFIEAWLKAYPGSSEDDLIWRIEFALVSKRPIPDPEQLELGLGYKM